MTLIDHFEMLQKLIRAMEELRITDEPMNDLAYVYKEAHDQALNDALNIVRREL
jgi:hypothetical protein